MAKTTDDPNKVRAQLLADLSPVDGFEDRPLVGKALQLAGRLQERGSHLQSPQERRQQAEFERMVQDEEGKATLTELTDQAFRAKNAKRIADQLTHILDVQGIPRFFTALDRAMLRGFQTFGGYLPGVSVPMVKDKMREETANVILPAEAALLAKHLRARHQQGLRMNLNFLGEALLGEEDAASRLRSYLQALQMPEIEVISVKVSTLYSQISPLSKDADAQTLSDRLELLYRAASKERFVRPNGEEVSKFVYLDMEEYRDLELTVDVFIETLSRPGLMHARAGIALQAYIPDSARAQQRINDWARKRVAEGGSPVTIRLVKGANMEMERVEASVHGWPLAPYSEKVDTDANFKKMLHRALEEQNIAAVQLGVASHNLFEVAYAMLLVDEAGRFDQVHFEMLEGMVNHQRRALEELVPELLLYAPATEQTNFVNAIGYLIRRLDENTGPRNFLRHAFKLEVGSEQWNRLQVDFVESIDRMDGLDPSPRRQQDRRKGPSTSPPPNIQNFCNEPDTDFSLPQNREWAQGIIEAWRDRHGDDASKVPCVIAGQELWEDRKIVENTDPSRPGFVVSRTARASSADIDRALECAKQDSSGWRDRSPKERSEILGRVADAICEARGELMGAALCEAGKLLSESDPEVSEAIDFVRYYAATAEVFYSLQEVRARPLGTVAVIPPWNFPIAIPCGGISAGLAAGNTVIVKPASPVSMVAYRLCQCFWSAGVPKEALQFVPCSGSGGGAQIVASKAVDCVILTGGTSTAMVMLDQTPDLNLLAETGGKNATIVTAMSDRELAIGHVLRSAFGHSGQKCSATSLLILESEVYDDPSFRETLVDAAKSMKVASSWELDTSVGPLTTDVGEDLERGLKDLEKGESWALMPKRVAGNPRLYSPGIKWGTTPGNYSHLTEFFGPVLCVLRADSLEHAIEMVNQTGYGLTSGLQSLDKREHELWKEKIRAGNLYINRGTTGAIVLRQPFGGVGKSAFGPGIKAGGPNYVAQLMEFSDAEGAEHGLALPERLQTLFDSLAELMNEEGEREALLRALHSYALRFAEEFSEPKDDVRLVGQDNFRRYIPVEGLRIRVTPEDSVFEILARVCAGAAAGCRMTISSLPGAHTELLAALDRSTEEWGAHMEFVEESDEQLAEVIAAHETDRVRYAARERVPELVRRAVGETGVYIADRKVLCEGRIELLWYLAEQSISHDYHRYGNLGARSGEERAPLPTE